MKKILIALILLIIVQSIGGIAVGADSFYPVKIINKANLPAGRLAEAIAAKGLLIGDAKLLREAAKLMPNNPEYWYLAAVIQSSGFRGIPGTTQRRLLERSLAADPNYLPALYAYAITKPSHEQRIQALERIAFLDKDNAKAYYMMAVEQYKNITENRQMVFDVQAYKMSSVEWRSVLEFIKKGNERPVYKVWSISPLSPQDIKIKNIPRSSNKDFLAMMTSLIVSGAESNFAFNVYSRQIARQTYWEAEKESKNNDQAQALDTLQIVKTFARKYAASEPNRYLPFMVGKLVWAIADKEEIAILKQMKRDDEILKLQQESKKWDDAYKKISSIVFKPEYINKFDVNGIAKEEANMKTILAEF